jgi:hypothetical protein
MTSTTRFAALAAPLLVLFYGIMRFVDGLDGDRGNGLAWDVGHTAFFVAFVFYALLAVRLHREVPVATRKQRTVRNVALGGALVGAAAFLWVTLTDLFSALDVSLPDAAQAVLPALFVLGTVTLLAQAVAARLLPRWSPILVLVGFLAISVRLDTLPIAALVILCGLAPLAMGARRPVGP